MREYSDKVIENVNLLFPMTACLVESMLRQLHYPLLRIVSVFHAAIGRIGTKVFSRFRHSAYLLTRIAPIPLVLDIFQWFSTKNLFSIQMEMLLKTIAWALSAEKMAIQILWITQHLKALITDMVYPRHKDLKIKICHKANLIIKVSFYVKFYSFEISI